SSTAERLPTADETSLRTAAKLFATRLIPISDSQTLAASLQNMALTTLNPHRALSVATRVALSLEKSDSEIKVSPENLAALLRLCGSSEFFGEMVASSPVLITTLGRENVPLRRDYRSVLRTSINAEKDFSAELSSLRRAWARLIVEIGTA